MPDKHLKGLSELLTGGYTYRQESALVWYCDKSDGTAYRLYHDPVTLDIACGCPSRKICKHIRGLWTIQRLVPSLNIIEEPV